MTLRSAVDSLADAPPFDSRELRDTLGRFATGVTVVTTLDPNGVAIGLTVSSFNSVSLEPPLVLWSLSADSPSREAFESAHYYAINVLAADQAGVSNQFASRLADKFDGVDWRPGVGGAPLLSGCCAWFEVKNTQRVAGGDHLIFIGEVVGIDRDPSRAPLLFHDGRYRLLGDVSL